MGQSGSAERDEEVRRQTSEEVKAELREDEAHKPLVLKKADIIVNKNPYPDPISGLSQRDARSFYGGGMMGGPPSAYPQPIMTQQRYVPPPDMVQQSMPQQQYMPPQQVNDPYRYRYGRPDELEYRQQVRNQQRYNIFHQYADPNERSAVGYQQAYAPTYKSRMMTGAPPPEPTRSERLLSYLGVPGGKL